MLKDMSARLGTMSADTFHDFYPYRSRDCQGVTRDVAAEFIARHNDVSRGRIRVHSRQKMFDGWWTLRHGIQSTADVHVLTNLQPVQSPGSLC